MLKCTFRNTTLVRCRGQKIRFFVGNLGIFIDLPNLHSLYVLGLFLVDAGYTVYLWQGWLEQELDLSENITTGSRQHRFDVDRRCAMQTCLDYCRGKTISYYNLFARVYVATRTYICFFTFF